MNAEGDERFDDLHGGVLPWHGVYDVRTPSAIGFRRV